MRPVDFWPKDHLPALIRAIQEFQLARATDPTNEFCHRQALFARVEADCGKAGAHAAVLLATIFQERSIVMNDNKITVTNSAVGILNTGLQVGKINATAKLIASQSGTSAQDLADAIVAITEALRDSPDLSDASRAEALDVMEAVAEAAAPGAAPPKPGVVKALIGSLVTTISVSANLVKLWDKFGPAIRLSFGLDP